MVSISTAKTKWKQKTWKISSSVYAWLQKTSWEQFIIKHPLQNCEMNRVERDQ